MISYVPTPSAKLIEALSLAFILEASGYPKPGNVHRLYDRRALRYEAFLATGVVAYKFLRYGFVRGLKEKFKRVVFGDLVYGIIRDVASHLKSSNTCLGSSLLLSLMAVSAGLCTKYGFKGLNQLSSCAKNVISKTTAWDTIYYYMAIRKAAPSYLKPADNTGGYVNVWDPTYRKKILEKNHRLVDVLQYSSRLDAVAKEAITGFEQGITAEEFLRSRFATHHNFNRAVVETYLYLLSRNIDTVVYLKHGLSTALAVMERARSLLNTIMSVNNDSWLTPVVEFDNELQKRGVNPGTTADLTAEVLALYMTRNAAEEGILLDLSH